MGYEDARKRARQIAMVTESRFMPPWSADSHGEFLNERRLTAAQMGALRQWADADAPEGSPADRPSPPSFPSGWQLGEPDDRLEPEEPYTLGAEGSDMYRCFVLPTHYAEDRYVSAVEVRPGNRAVVHHVLIFLDTSGTARRKDAEDPAPGYTSFGGLGFLPAGSLGGWAPGITPAPYPDGVGNLLPKGADVVLQVHYHRSGK